MSGFILYLYPIKVLCSKLMSMLHRILSILSVTFFCFFGASNALAKSPVVPGDTVYVDLAAVGVNDGTSWLNAYTDLQNAISTEPASKIFLVARGTYFPGVAGNAAATFTLKDGQQLWGGFPAGGADFSLRDPKTEVTTLSGDLNNNNANEDGTDAKTVLTISGLTIAVKVDGFVISGAANNGGNGGGIYINDCSGTFNNNIIEKNQADYGAGVYCQITTATAPVIAKNLIRQNTCLNIGKGGGLYVTGEVFANNNVITENSSFFGGGLFVTESSADARFVNNTIVSNVSPPAPASPGDTCPSISGVLFQNLGGRALFHNNIIWDNLYTETADANINQFTMYSDPTAGNVRNNITGNAVLNGVNGNLNINPTLNLDYTLMKCSPALDKGDNTLLYTAGYSDSTDYQGLKRLFDGNYDMTITIDMGAMESDIVCEPCTTDAGVNASICGLQYTMTAETPGYKRKGIWTQLSGPGTTTYSYDTLETAVITVSQQGEYRYMWIMTGTDCSIADEVVVTFYAMPTPSAGADASVCGKNLVLAATPSSGTGIWTAVESGVAFVNNTQPNTTAAMPGYSSYHLVWSETNGNCPVKRDTVIVNSYQQNVANAGLDANGCQFNTSLNAIPHIGTGVWSKMSGPGAASFTTPNNPQTPVTVSAVGTYIFRWTETNGVCPSSTDAVTITFKPQPIANAGVDIDTCGTSFALKAVPSSGTGVWSVVSGAGTVSFVQNNFAKTGVTVSDIGQYVLRWTETNSPCPSNSDDVVVDLAVATSVSLENISEKYCGVSDTIRVGVLISGVPPYTFIVESQHFKDTILTNDAYYVFSDSGAFKEQSQLTFKITSFVDGRNCGAIYGSNLVTVVRQGEDLAPVGNGFTVSEPVLCTSSSTLLNLEYSNFDDLVFTILDVAKNSTFMVSYQGAPISVPITNLSYGDNKFIIVSATKAVGGCQMNLQGITELNVIYKPVQYTLKGEHLTCFQSNDGSIFITDAPHSSDFTEVLLNGNVNTNLLNNLSEFNLVAGNYSVRVTNDAGCILSRTVSIAQPAMINYSYAIVNPTCNGLNNGSVQINTTGGTGSLTLHFNGATEKAPFKFINLGAGKYPLKITDDNTGCIVFADSVEITEPDSLKLYSQSVDANCDGSVYGNLTLFVVGGTQPYTAQVTKGAYFLNVASVTSPYLITNLNPGIYNIKLVDSKGCLVTGKDTIAQGVEIVFGVAKIKDYNCQSLGIIEITEPSSDPEVTYSIDGVNFGTTTLFENLVPDTYTITAKAATGCVNRKTITILDKNSPLDASAVIVKEPTCFNKSDGVVQINVTGGSGNFVIVVDGQPASAETTIDSLSPGTHNYVVVDLDCGLVVTLSNSLFNPSNYSTQVSFVRNPTCSYSTDGLLRLIPNGGTPGDYQYSVNGGSTYQFGNLFTNLKGGQYQMRVKDEIGCESQILDYTLVAPDSLALNTSFDNDFVTRTSNITAVAAGGTDPYYYSIDGVNFAQANTFNDVPFNYIIVYLVDSAGCRNSDTLALGDVGIDNLVLNNQVKINPNPSTGVIGIEGIDTHELTEIAVYSVIGEKLLSFKPSASELKHLDLSSLNSGYYLLLVSTKTSSSVHRVELMR